MKNGVTEEPPLVPVGRVTSFEPESDRMKRDKQGHALFLDPTRRAALARLTTEGARNLSMLFKRYDRLEAMANEAGVREVVERVQGTRLVWNNYMWTSRSINAWGANQLERVVIAENNPPPERPADANVASERHTSGKYNE